MNEKGFTLLGVLVRAAVTVIIIGMLINWFDTKFPMHKNDSTITEDLRSVVKPILLQNNN